MSPLAINALEKSPVIQMRRLRLLVVGEPMPGKTRVVFLGRQLRSTRLLVSPMVNAWTFSCVYKGI
jgi:hypothetical protein